MKKNRFYLLLVLVISLMAACSENKTNTQIPATADAKSEDQDKSVTTEMKLVKDGKLTFAMSGLLKPLNYKENQELVGFDVEIGKEISKRIGLEANPVTNPWETIIQGLRGDRKSVV